MNRLEYLLTQVASEAVEVAHRATKALHFGLAELQPGQDLTNAKRLVGEVMDLAATLQMLEDEEHIEMPPFEEGERAMDAKRAKVEHFMQYAITCGTLQPAAPACEHDWISARNEVIKSGLSICTKCEKWALGEPHQQEKKS